MAILTLKDGTEVQFDDEFQVDVSRHVWGRAHRGGRRIYAMNKRAPGGYLHRFLMLLAGRLPDGMQVDHINGDTLDCRLSNMRAVTKSQNHRNQGVKSGPRRTNKTGFIGVHGVPGGRFCVTIQGPERTLYVGRFDNVHEAAAAYDSKAVELRGEFARTNYPRVA